MARGKKNENGLAVENVVANASNTFDAAAALAGIDNVWKSEAEKTATGEKANGGKWRRVAAKLEADGLSGRIVGADGTVALAHPDAIAAIKAIVAKRGGTVEGPKGASDASRLESVAMFSVKEFDATLNALVEAGKAGGWKPNVVQNTVDILTKAKNNHGADTSKAVAEFAGSRNQKAAKDAAAAEAAKAEKAALAEKGPHEVAGYRIFCMATALEYERFAEKGTPTVNNDDPAVTVARVAAVDALKAYAKAMVANGKLIKPDEAGADKAAARIAAALAFLQG